MCGFAGIIHWSAAAPPPVTDACLDAVDELIAHRGPDGAGRWRDPKNPGCILLHRRLSILDRPGGAQPMANEDQTVQVVFNGEIYNHRALRAELRQLGHQFASDHSDTEVLVHGWEEWNTQLPEKLIGMFAFAVWDARKHTLFLARDRMGQKPLFYQSNSGTACFASTLPALLTLGAKTKVSPSALAGYLTHGYFPPPGTAYADVWQLQPGHWWCAQNGTISQECYWRPAVGAASGNPEGSLAEVVTAAVDSQMEADVPVACFLSGGIDSTIIAGLMQRRARQAGGDNIMTISVGFQEDRFDETAYAAIAAQHIGSRHHTFQVGVGEHVVETLQWLMRYTLGQPFADSSILPTYYLANCTRGIAPCAISGDGGDELFGGYDRYRALRLITAAPAISRLAAEAFLRMNRGERARRFHNAAQEQSWSSRYAALTRLFSQADIGRLFPDMSAEDHLLSWPPDQERPDDVIRAAMELDQRHYLPGDVLWKVDSASMANALEVRSPYLDHRVIGCAAQLPTSELVNFRSGKLALRRTFADLLPAAIAQRRKHGFGLPIGDWFRGQLYGPLRDLLLSRNSFLGASEARVFVDQLINEHKDGRRDHTHRLFALLMLELWHRECRAEVGSCRT